ncbi:hypothetical protein [Nonomuraea diastatica]|uniref:Centromere-binding protein ParB C-terminal domain-containing protein n=1 Tax=Nonomuraea diastatica TaxID=1848329 RepID=A0A4R4VH88_9ACTN|nr:hypothetical protein [Nonomuraea diastatica]TDD04792.1 hypothetical protein E1294_49940 [Nonomuraea diastatica]
MATSDAKPDTTAARQTTTAQRRSSGRLPEPDPAEGEELQPSPKEAAEKYISRSFYLPANLVERVRACVRGAQARAYGTLQEDEVPESIAQLVTVALERECQRLEDTFNEGKPFPRVFKKLRPGPRGEGAERGAAKRRGRQPASFPEDDI